MAQVDAIKQLSPQISRDGTQTQTFPTEDSHGTVEHLERGGDLQSRLFAPRRTNPDAHSNLKLF